MQPSSLPALVAAAGAKRASLLDVRPLIDSGGDPFQLILRTVQNLADDEALELLVGFEPVPLYTMMASLGRRAHTERSGEVVHVWLYKDERALPSPTLPSGTPRVPLLPPTELDVRTLEPPGPMVAILEKLVELGPGAQLLVRHHREPVHLYEKLAVRGYAARTQRRGEGDYLVHVAPSWAFDAPGT